jgi:TRAP-type mannitol/chloroaromatic compound transport system permease small subunit
MKGCRPGFTGAAAERVEHMRRILKVVDTMSEWSGSSARWFCVALVVVGSLDTFMRYAVNAPTIWAYETSSMLGGSIYALGWAYAHLHKSHIRVDIFFSRLSERGQAIADIICSALFFFPLMGVLIYKAWFWALRAWARGEVMMESYWYPPAGPFRTVIAIGITLLLLQGLVKLIRDIHFAAGRGHLD